MLLKLRDMNKQIIAIVIVLLLSIAISNNTYAENSFAPWSSDVKIADENIDLKSLLKKQKLITATKKKNHNHLISETHYHPKKRLRTVYNGAQAAAFFLIRFFQIVISPQDGPNCRFNPVCSAYGKKAVERYGGLLGAILAGERILRCNPYSPPGDDPVPDTLFDR